MVLKQISYTSPSGHCSRAIEGRLCRDIDLLCRLIRDPVWRKYADLLHSPKCPMTLGRVSQGRPKDNRDPFGYHREPVRTYPLSLALLGADQITNHTAAPANVDRDAALVRIEERKRPLLRTPAVGLSVV
jgi:hypothetical protein